MLGVLPEIKKLALALLLMMAWLEAAKHKNAPPILQQISADEAQVEKKSRKESRSVSQRELRRQRREEGDADQTQVLDDKPGPETNKPTPLVDQRATKETAKVEAPAPGAATSLANRLLNLTENSLRTGGSTRSLRRGATAPGDTRPDLGWLKEHTLLERMLRAPAKPASASPARKQHTVNEFTGAPIPEPQVRLSPKPRKGSFGYDPKAGGAAARQDGLLDDDPLWLARTPLAPSEAALRVRTIHESRSRLLPCFVSITTQNGQLSDASEARHTWYKPGDALKLALNTAYKVEVDAGYGYRRQDANFRTSKPGTSLDMPLVRWCEPSRLEYKPVNYFSEIKPFDNGQRWDAAFYQQVHETSGLFGWAIAHPIKVWLNRPVPHITLPYDSFWEMSTAMHAKERLWLPVQSFQVDDVHIQVIGAYNEVRHVPTSDKLQDLFKLLAEAHERGGIVAYGSPAGHIRQGGASFSPLELLAFCGAGVDLLEVNDEAGRAAMLGLLRRGIAIPFLKKSPGLLGAAPATSNLMVKAGADASLPQVLEAMRAGRMMVGEDFNLLFQLEDAKGTAWSVGDHVPLSGASVTLAPAAHFNLNPDRAGISAMELVVNGVAQQQTRLAAPLLQGSAMFGAIQFHAGDSVLLRLTRQDGGDIWTNAIHIGPPARKPRRGLRQVPVQVEVSDLRPGRPQALALMVRANRFFSEKSLRNGRAELEMPLDASIEIWGENVFRKVSLLDEVTKALLQKKSAPGGNANFTTNDLQDLFPIPLRVTLNAP